MKEAKLRFKNIGEMLAFLDRLRKDIEHNAKFDKRLDFTIKRMVKAENRMELRTIIKNISLGS